MRNATIISTFIGILVAPIALFLAILSGAAGHGSYFFAKIFFPFTMASTYFLESITPPFIILALIQFPIYGWLIGRAITNKTWRIPAWIVGVAHVALALLLCFISPEHFG